jgi:hypothetical protein
MLSYTPLFVADSHPLQFQNTLGLDTKAFFKFGTKNLKIVYKKFSQAGF